MGVCANLTSCDDDDEITSSEEEQEILSEDEYLEEEREEVYKEITVEIAGTLSSFLGEDMYEVTSLKVSGPLNGDDIICLRTLCDCESSDIKFFLTSLDLSDASIVEGGGHYFSGDDQYENYIDCDTSNDEIGAYMFRKAYYLEKIILPNTVTSIGDYAFYGCSSLTEVTLPESLTSIGKYAFNHCSLTEVTIPSSLTSIGEGIFSNCSSLTEVTIPSSVTSIEDGAFDCCGLTKLTLGERIASIGRAFEGCTNLTEVYCYATEVPSVGSMSFYNISSDAILYVPQASWMLYLGSDWAKFFSSIKGI